MKKCPCLLCHFENPKPTATAVIIKNQKLLVVKRKDPPFNNKWDFVGGYVNKNEPPPKALSREIKEELGTACTLTSIGPFTGTASYQDFAYPVINFAYLTQLHGKIKLDKKENSHYAWKPIKSLRTIAFDSNQKILKYIKENLTFDLNQVRQLVSQLDPGANVNEQSLYQAALTGYVSQIKKGQKLIGMGWIYPRQTILRRQAVIEDMIVDEKYRGQGLGKKIILDLIKWAKKQGIEVVELTTNPKRIAANHLYQKVGFKIHPTNHYLLNL